uniref:Uncharacterized protein n=1 Tax=Tanacetum cinerariifolium TaxID=118510 RepID=A0A6L2K6T0_TANCI|nr:hypothetical protein [Tanacetum cinerariifolium]
MLLKHLRDNLSCSSVSNTIERMNDRRMQSKEKKKLQIQEVQSNTVHESKVGSIVMENTCSRKENAKERYMTHEGKVDSREALDVILVDTKCSETKSEKYVTSSRSENDTHVADANKEPMAKAPFLEEKKGVRFVALYLQKKRNLLVFDHFKQQFSYLPMLVQSSSGSISGLALHEMTFVTHSVGLMPKPPSSAPFVPPTRNDWDTLLQPLFDEYSRTQPNVDA